MLLAVSGGLDSMVLLHQFAQGPWANRGIRVEVAHIHHGVRGACADADAQWVQNTCTQFHIPFHLHHLEPQTLEGPGGFEKRARDARYAALKHIQEQRQLQYLVTAHHLDDQAETLCLRILRGTTLWGLQGVWEFRPDAVWRPLLDWSRSQLHGYAQTYGVSWREDASNRSMDYARNRIRHQLLPALQHKNPGISAQMARVAKRCQHLWPHLQAQMQTFFAPAVASLPPWVDSFLGGRPAYCVVLHLSHASFIGTHWDLFKLWLARQGISWPTTSEEPRLLQALQSQTLHRMRLGDIQVECCDGKLWWHDTRSWSVSSDNMYLFTMLRSGSEELGVSSEAGLRASIHLSPQASLALEIRLRRPGDRFSPPQLCSTHRKLKQWLQESGIPSSWRERLWVVACGHDVVWIPGFGVSGLFKPTPQSSNVMELRLEWKKNP